MANNTTTKVTVSNPTNAGRFEEVTGVSTVAEVLSKLNLAINGYTISVNGSAATERTALNDGDFVSFNVSSTKSGLVNITVQIRR
tara:strand:+ start:1471 stop:1725 length:255 start_codon:yes stop_codon:yes gene_type:complete